MAAKIGRVARLQAHFDTEAQGERQTDRCISRDGHQQAGRNQHKREHGAKQDETADRRQHKELVDQYNRNAQGQEEGNVADGRRRIVQGSKQSAGHGRKGDGTGTFRPCGRDPKERTDTHSDARPPVPITARCPDPYASVWARYQLRRRECLRSASAPDRRDSRQSRDWLARSRSARSDRTQMIDRYEVRPA